MCNWHWSIKKGNSHLGSVAFAGGRSADTIAEATALRRAIRLAAGATNRDRDARASVRIERCSCNGVHETVYPFLDGGVVEPEHLWAEWDPWYADEEERAQPIYSVWQATSNTVVADKLTYQQALAAAEADPDALVALKQPPQSAYTFVVFDKTGGSFFRAQRQPLDEWLQAR